jgi:hypothetical protein
LTVPRNLGELTQQAQTIVRGHVVSARVERHPQLTNLHTVVVTLRVEEALKGNPPQFLTFRQFIWDVRDRFDAAGYAKGQELLLLMNAPTKYGLSSPAGMEQGRFRVLHDARGNKTAVNGYGNSQLFHQLPQQMKSQGVQLSAPTAALVAKPGGGAVPLDQLEEVIRQFAGSGK